MDRIKKYVNNKVTKFALMLIIISVIGGATVLYIDHEKNERIKMERLQAERQAAIDDATARAQQAEIDAKAERQKLMQTTINKIKDYGEIVVMKYEFSHETSYEKSGALPFLSKNMLKLKIDYETEYKINISNLSIYVDNDEIYLVYNPKDFELLASVKKITKQATDKKEQGWIPVDFTNEETIALINSDIDYISNELSIGSSEFTNTEEVCEQFENVIQNLFNGFGIKINTINNNQGLPYIKIENNGEE